MKEEINIDILPKGYIGKTILDLDLRKKTGCTVIGYRHIDKDYIIYFPRHPLAI